LANLSRAIAFARIVTTHRKAARTVSPLLQDQAAIVTGGGKGIGRAIALRLAQEGASVAICGRDAMALEATADSIRAAGGSVLTQALDVAEQAAVEAFVNAAHSEFGRLDILVNNAAEQHTVDGLEELTAQQLEQTFRTNVFGFFYMTKAALPHLGKGSTIINTTSITAFKGHETLLDYSATKGAIVSFTRSLSQLLMDKGIRVNAVAPGPIWTPLIPASFDAKKVAEHGKSAPMKRAGQPNEVAPCFVFLASEEASYMSGQILHPNGGTIAA
jgi:NAD(P)-dependent dehydrogenase (short-subunit alcohol dehydrogenase family)